MVVSPFRLMKDTKRSMTGFVYGPISASSNIWQATKQQLSPLFLRLKFDFLSQLRKQLTEKVFR